jgi:hypothetical protein
MNDYLKKEANKNENLFSKYCPPECNSISYEITPFTYIFKSNGVNNLYDSELNSQNKQWMTFKSYEQAKQSLFFYSIYFDKFKFMTIEDMNDTLDLNVFDLIAKLSGIISLFFAFISFAFMTCYLKKKRSQVADIS